MAAIVELKTKITARRRGKIFESKKNLILQELSGACARPPSVLKDGGNPSSFQDEQMC